MLQDKAQVESAELSKGDPKLTFRADIQYSARGEGPPSQLGECTAPEYQKTYKSQRGSGARTFSACSFEVALHRPYSA